MWSIPIPKLVLINSPKNHFYGCYWVLIHGKIGGREESSGFGIRYSGVSHPLSQINDDKSDIVCYGKVANKGKIKT